MAINQKNLERLRNWTTALGICFHGVSIALVTNAVFCDWFKPLSISEVEYDQCHWCGMSVDNVCATAILN